MSARDEALALLRERFPEPWKFVLAEPGTRAAEFDVAWLARAKLGGEYNGARVQGWSLDGPVAAARACIAAWDEATKGERSAVRKAAGEAIAQASLPVIGDLREAHAGERKLADRLAEALKELRNWGSMGARGMQADSALSAWRTRRGKATTEG